MAQQPPLTKKEYVEYYSYFAITLGRILNIGDAKWNLIKQFDIVNLSSNNKQFINELNLINPDIEPLSEYREKLSKTKLGGEYNAKR